MGDTTPIQLVLFLLTAVVGGATALTRDTRKQVLVLTLFGFSLTLLFLSLKAPDVAYSELVIGAAVLPLMILTAIVKTGGGRSR